MTNPQDPLFCRAVRIAFPNGSVRIAPIPTLLEYLHHFVSVGTVPSGVADEIGGMVSDLEGLSDMNPRDAAGAYHAFLSAVRKLPWNVVYPATFRSVPDPKPRHSQWWGGEPFTHHPSSLQVTLCSLRDYLGPRWTLGADTHGTRPDLSDALSLGNAREILAWLYERPYVVHALQNLAPTAEALFGPDVPLRLRIETEYETGDQTLIAVVGASGRWGENLDECAYYTAIEQNLSNIRDAVNLDRETGLEFGPA